MTAKLGRSGQTLTRQTQEEKSKSHIVALLGETSGLKGFRGSKCRELHSRCQTQKCQPLQVVLLPCFLGNWCLPPCWGLLMATAASDWRNMATGTTPWTGWLLHDPLCIAAILREGPHVACSLWGLWQLRGGWRPLLWPAGTAGCSTSCSALCCSADG